MPFKSDKRLKRFYDKLNKLYYENRLSDDTQVGWNDEIGGYGLTIAIDDEETQHKIFMIYVDKKKHFDFRQVLMTIVHEIAHVALYPCMNHRKKFQNELRRLAMLGAFDNLW